MAQSESVLAVRVKEALGMKVIFRADDLGMSEGINYGIAKAISCGPIKSVGLMPNMPAASHGFDLVAASGVSVGNIQTSVLVSRFLTPRPFPRSWMNTGSSVLAEPSGRARRTPSCSRKRSAKYRRSSIGFVR